MVNWIFSSSSSSSTIPPATQLSEYSFETLFKALKKGDYVVISSKDFSRFFHIHKCDGRYGDLILASDFSKKHSLTRFDVSQEKFLLGEYSLKQDIIKYAKDGYSFYECTCSLRDLAKDFIPKMTSDRSYYEPW
jgi:hypothetical protein